MRSINCTCRSGFKSLAGGEIKGLTKLTSDVREELIQELKEKATNLGANAVVGLRSEQPPS